MNVVVVAEFYPRAHDPVLGVWAHRQALAAQAAGANVRVLVLHRIVPPLRALKKLRWPTIRATLTHPKTLALDGLQVQYVKFFAPPRALSYGSWGAWVKRPLKRALQQLQDDLPIDLIHAHYAVPAGDAVRRAGLTSVPLVTYVHGGDVLHTALRSRAGHRAVQRTFAASSTVLANSRGIAELCTAAGAHTTRVVHLGTDIPTAIDLPAKHEIPTLVTVSHLIERKRHADVITAMHHLRNSHSNLQYKIIGDGPERKNLEQLAGQLGLRQRVEFLGQLDHQAAIREAQRATLFVLPSVDEAFGVAYIEAMAGAVPAIGCTGEAGPEAISAAGPGLELVPSRNPFALAVAIGLLLKDSTRRHELSLAARQTVTENFTWTRCGVETVAAYAVAVQQAAERPSRR